MRTWVSASFLAALASIFVFLSLRKVSQQKRTTFLSQLLNSVPEAISAPRKIDRSGEALLNLLYRGKYREIVEAWLVSIVTSRPTAERDFRKQKQRCIFLTLAFTPFLFFTSYIMLFLLVVLFFAPELLLYNAVLKHKEEVSRSLPETIDLLSMCVEAGLNFTAALTRVGRMQGGAMGAELVRLNREVRLGSSPSNAFLALADRTSEVQIHRLVNALNQVDRLGAPISLVLKEQGAEFREVKRARAREEAQKVPVKILAPIMLCFLPALLVIVIAPAILAIMETFGGL